MRARQSLPRQWLIVEAPLGTENWNAIRRLSRGSGILVLGQPSASGRRRLRQLARSRALTLAEESRGNAARVHNIRELRAALLRRTALILLSPIHETRSHPDWQPMPRMRAATLARLAGRQALALGGMNEKRCAKIAPLGFIGWAGISAFRT